MSSTVQSDSGWLPDQYFSGGLSISGLTESGSDFGTMIEQLRKIEMIPTQRMLRWKSEWQARQEAFSLVRESLTNLRDVCAKMNSMDKFLVKKASSSQPNFATATASSSAVQNSYKLEIDQVASTAIWNLNKSFADSKTIVNKSGANATFAYEYNGKVRNLTVGPNTTLEQLKNMINNDAQNPGIRASLIQGADGVTLQIKGMDQGEKHDLAILSTNGLDFGASEAEYGKHKIAYNTGILSSKINDGSSESNRANTYASAQTFTLSYNGESLSVNIPAHATLQQFKDTVNAEIAKYRDGDAGPPPIAAHPGFDLEADIDTSGEYAQLTFTGAHDGVPIIAPSGSGHFENLGKLTTLPAVDGGGVPIGDPPSWNVQHSQNARIKVDGWPAGDANWLEVDSNVVSGVVDGVTFTLIGEGTTTVSVSTDAEAITENVVGFIDAMNDFRSVINELTKYDANKATVDYNYAYSQFDMQKGSLLTGNYGVQLISSRIKQATAGMPMGFLPQFKEGDLFLGDMYTSLSQMGVKTKADGTGGNGFGLLELNTDPNMPMLDDVLAKNPEAVAEFFACLNKGVSDSSHFSYASSMQNITRPGAYEVTYELDANGKVKPGTAFINGKAAKYYEDLNQIGLTRTPPSSSDNKKVTAEGTTDFDVDVKVLETAERASTSVTTGYTSASNEAVVGPGGGTLTFDYDGTTYSVDVREGDTLQGIANRVNYLMPNRPGNVTASTYKNADGTYSLKVENGEWGAGTTAVTNMQLNFTPTDPAKLDQADVVDKAAKNATYKLADPAGSGTYTEYTSKSNTITDKVKGATFTLKESNVTAAEYANDADPNTGTRVTGQAYNDADGIYVQIDNMTPSTPGTPYTGTVRIKQGKVNEILELLNGTPNKPEEGILGSSGTLQVLVDNYNKIIAGIDSKIERETDRLIKWERTTKLRFSRLEATIKQYESLQASIESQIKQLGSNSSS